MPDFFLYQRSPLGFDNDLPAAGSRYLVYATQWVYPVSLYSQVWQKSEKQRHAPAGRINVVSGALYQPCGTRGSGNLAGVALAISAGGPGAVFWMWVTALIGMATSLPNVRSPSSTKRRIKRPVSRRPGLVYGAWLGCAGWACCSRFLLLAYGLIFNTVQANSVAHALRYAFSCPEWLAGAC
jgi:Na+/alanine symporter